MKVMEVVRLLVADGWFEVPAKGGHRQFKHPTKPGRTTVPWHRGDLPVGTVASIERQARLKLRGR